jgi:hypothetical protein
MLKDSATKDLKAELEQLRKENAEMKDIKNNYEQKVLELERAKRDYEWKENNLRYKIEQEVKRLRLSKLLEDFQTTLYCVRNTGKEKPKCDKCDENGYIDYLSPRGTKQREKCVCRDRGTYYTVESTYCSEFKIAEYGEERNNKIVGWYKLHSDRDKEYYTSSEYASDKIYKGQDFDKIENYYYCYFRDEKTAQNYADWLNKNLESEETE